MVVLLKSVGYNGYERKDSMEKGGTHMPYELWMATAIPVIVAGGTLHFKMKEQSDKRWNFLSVHDDLGNLMKTE